jgi:proteasome activator subunit 4
LRRNFFALTGAQLDKLLSVFETCLQDDKLEIRILAGNTLSGLIKVLPAEQFNTLKSRITGEAQAVFPGRRNKQQAPESPIKLHGTVLKLAALLQSSPYQVCEWYVCLQKMS